MKHTKKREGQYLDSVLESTGITREEFTNFLVKEKALTDKRSVLWFLHWFMLRECSRILRTHDMGRMISKSLVNLVNEIRQPYLSNPVSLAAIDKIKLQHTRTEDVRILYWMRQTLEQ